MAPTFSIMDGSLPGDGGPIPIRDYEPAEPRRVALLWMHGGGFSGGSFTQPESTVTAEALAAAGYYVRSIDYRLAPAFKWRRELSLAPSATRYPAGIDDVLNAYADLRQQGHEAVLLGGASAGACIAASAAIQLRERGAIQADGLVLLYGTYHAELPPLSDELRKAIRGPVKLIQFTPEAVHRMNLNYVGTEALLDSVAFPGGSDLRGLPRTLMLDGERDSLRASGDQFAAELEAAGVSLERHVIRKGLHGFVIARRSNASRQGIAALLEWMEGQPTLR